MLTVWRPAIYDFLTEHIRSDYIPVKELRRTERGSIVLVRHRQTHTPYVFRCYEGSAEVYHRLLFLDCPNLPRIYEAAEKNGQAVVLEEYVEGDTIQDLLKGALFTADETRAVVRGICRGLWVLHKHGAVHRDIKPENVILRGNEAVLIDFDAARIFKPEHSADTVVLGTTGFAAPEQYGMGQSDRRSDIYSLGVLMNVMLTGQHPSRKLAEGRFGRVISKCTMMDPAARYDSVEELLGAL